MRNSGGIRAPAKKRKRQFVKVGTIKVPWHRMGDGRTCIDPRRLGLERQTFADHDAAIAEATRIARDRHNGGAELAAFAPADRALYAEVLRRLTGSPHSILAVVDAGLAAMARPLHRVPDVALELLSSKQPHDFNKRYIRGLTSDVEWFAQIVSGDIGQIKPNQIESFLAGLCRPPWRTPFGIRRRNAALNNIRHLFTFAVQRNYLPADKTSAAHQVELIDAPSSPVEFYAVWEMELFIAHVREPFVPWLAVNSFSGARLEEIVLSRDAARKKDPLRWEDFDWAEREIAVRPETSKTGRARRIPIVDNLYDILTPWRDRKASGPICSKHPGDYETRRIVTRANAELTRTNDRRRVSWRKNALRHSYGSYRMAIIQNENQLAYEMGNSIEMVRAHYHNPRPKSEAAAWFTLRRIIPGNIIQLEIFG